VDVDPGMVSEPVADLGGLVSGVVVSGLMLFVSARVGCCAAFNTENRAKTPSSDQSERPSPDRH